MTSDIKAANASKSSAEKADVIDITSDEANCKVRSQQSLRPTVQAALTLREYGKKFGELSVAALVEDLGKQCAQAVAGDLSRAEAMLITQAHTLDVIFNTLASRAERQEYLPQFDNYLRLALKAQNQCRTTLESLAEIKNPRPTAFIKQQNIAANQQVNNEASPSGQGAHARAGNIENQPNELKVMTHAPGERLDFGAPAAAVRDDQAVEAVGAVNRTEDM